MLSRITSTDRREFLKRSVILLGVSLIGSAALAQKTKTTTETAIRFAITYKGQQFGAKVTPLKNGMTLLTVRELGGRKWRHAVAFRAQQQPAAVTFVHKGRRYQVKQQGNWVTTNIPGIKIGPPETSEPGGRPQRTSALGTKILREVVETVREVITHVVNTGGNVAEAAAEDVEEESQVDEKKKKETEKQDSGIVPPPPGTAEQPGVWY